MVIHGFSTRIGGISTGPWESCNLHDKKGDNPDNVRENRRRFLETLNITHAQLFTVCQEHTSRVIDVDDLSPEECEMQKADGMVTSRRNVVLGVTTADCLPVLLADASGKAIAALHAGWRGVVSGILENGVHLLCKKIGAIPSDIRVAIGVGIGPCCFEIGPEVQEEFISRGFPQEYFLPHNDRWKADLPSLAKWVLIQTGVTAIEVLPGCTFCQPDLFYSYRRDGWPTGLMMSVIALASKPTEPSIVENTPQDNTERPQNNNGIAQDDEIALQKRSSEESMRESIMESIQQKEKDTSQTPQENIHPSSPESSSPAPSNLWTTLRTFLRHPWGRRVASSIIFILLFLFGYIFGRWGRSDLESQLADRKNDVLQLKQKLETSENQKDDLKRKNQILQQQLRDSESQRVFYKHRGMLRASIASAQNHLKNSNFVATKEEMHKAIVYLQKESNQAQGIEAYFYQTITKRIRHILTYIETQCQTESSMSLLNLGTEAECRSLIAQELSNLHDALPAPSQE